MTEVTETALVATESALVAAATKLGALAARALAAGATSETFSEQELGLIQEATRKEGRCGSRQTSTGLPCRRHPAPGYTVCWKHGSRAPQTMAKAERVLAVARMPAVEWVLDELDRANADTCHECGYPHHSLKERKRIDALAFKLLDRTGLGPRQTIDVNSRKVDDNDLMLDRLNEDEKNCLAGLIRQLNDLKARVHMRLNGATEVVEGEGHPLG